MLWQTADGRTLEGWIGGDPDGHLVALLHGCPDTRHVAMTGDAAAREVVVRPRTSHLATLVAHWPEVLSALR